MASQSALLPFALALLLAMMLEHLVSPESLRATAVRAGLLHEFMSKRHDVVAAYDKNIEVCTRTTLELECG